jgi:hypothetical protein
MSEENENVQETFPTNLPNQRMSISDMNFSASESNNMNNKVDTMENITADGEVVNKEEEKINVVPVVEGSIPEPTEIENISPKQIVLNHVAITNEGDLIGNNANEEAYEDNNDDWREKIEEEQEDNSANSNTKANKKYANSPPKIKSPQSPNLLTLNGGNYETHITTNMNTYSPRTRGKKLIESINEKKLYQEKVKAINNRLKHLKEREDELKKKEKLNDEIKLKEEKIKSTKTGLKNDVIKAKFEKGVKLENKKQEIEDRKSKRKEAVGKAHENVVSKNKKNFDLARMDKVLLNTMLTQFNSHYMNMNNYKCLKIKQEINENKTNRVKKFTELTEKAGKDFEMRMERELREKEMFARQLEELERLEQSRMESFNKTTLSRDADKCDVNSGKKLGEDGDGDDLGGKGYMNRSVVVESKDRKLTFFDVNFDRNLIKNELTPVKTLQTTAKKSLRNTTETKPFKLSESSNKKSRDKLKANGSTVNKTSLNIGNSKRFSLTNSNINSSNNNISSNNSVIISKSTSQTMKKPRSQSSKVVEKKK